MYLIRGWAFALLGIAATNLIGQLICATEGAVLLIVLVRALRKMNRLPVP